MRTTIAAAFAALILIAGVAGVTAAPALSYDRAANEATMLQLINHARTQRGLAPVRLQGSLDAAAFSHSREMVERDYFSHSSIGGTSFSSRLRRAGYSSSGCSYWSVGEVIGWGKSYLGTPESIFRGWMRSSVHRPIILARRWRDVGIGCYRGRFRGLDGVIMYTVDFGRRSG